MEFHQKYELIEPLPGEGPKSFRARQGALGRDVTVHFLLGGQTQENQWLLARLRALPPNSLARIIEVGTNSDGTQYVVTVAPPFQHLMEWLQEQENAAAIEAQSLTRAGMWKVPAMTPPAAAPPVEPVPGTHQPPEPSPVASGPGEFTRMFQAPPAPPAPLATEEITQPIPSPVPPAQRCGRLRRLLRHQLRQRPLRRPWLQRSQRDPSRASLRDCFRRRRLPRLCRRRQMLWRLPRSRSQCSRRCRPHQRSGRLRRLLRPRRHQLPQALLRHRPHRSGRPQCQQLHRRHRSRASSRDCFRRRRLPRLCRRRRCLSRLPRSRSQSPRRCRPPRRSGRLRRLLRPRRHQLPQRHLRPPPQRSGP